MTRKKTIVLPVDAANPEPETLARAAAVIRRGGLVAFPTETVYGLGANALDPLAAGRIFEAKERPPDNPLIVHIAATAELDDLAAAVPDAARLLAARFWPGPLTLILPRSDRVPLAVTAGLPAVAIRLPAHPVARGLIRAARLPIAAPSANRSGQVSPTCAEHVLEDLEGRIDMVLDGGPTDVGLESTVLDLTATPPVIFRPGGIPAEDLRAAIGEIHTQAADANAARRSPGTRYRHYATRARLILTGSANVEGEVRKLIGAGKRVGVMTRNPVPPHPELVIRIMPSEPRQYAREFFGVLRELDRKGCDAIVVERVEEASIGAAIMDRLRRAASEDWE